MLERMRAAAVARLADECRITRPSDEPGTVDPDTLELVPVAGETVYDGMCSVQDGPGQGGGVEEQGGADVAERVLLLELPGGTVGPRRGDEVEILTVGPDASPDLAGRRFVVDRDDPRSRHVRTLLAVYDRHHENP